MSDTRHRPGPFAAVPMGPVATGERDSRFDNQPPLGERISMEFEDDLAEAGLIERAATLTEAIDRAPPCDSTANVGKVGDFVKQIGAFEKALEAVREKHNRPLIEARGALKARTDGLFAPLAGAVARMRADMNRFMAAEAARAERERREAFEQAERLRKAAEEAAKEKEAETGIPAESFMPEIQPRKVEAPVARGDYGARVGTRTVHCHEIESVRKLPDRLLKHPQVVEVLNKIIAAEIRTAKGQCTINGVRIWQEQQAAVR